VNTPVKSLSITALGLTAFFAAVSQCAAGPVALEEFDYSVGAINGQNGGTGWAGPWTDTDNPAALVVHPGLTFTDANGVPLATFGNALGPTRSSGVAQRLLTTPIVGTPGTSLILSAIIQSNVPGATFTQATLGNSSGVSGSTFTIGELPETDPRAANWGLQDPNGTALFSSKPVIANAPTWLVAEIDFASSGDRIRLWVDPPVTDWFTAPPDISETIAHQTTFKFSGVFWQTQQGQQVDEISISTALTSTCVPPPNTTMVAWYPFDAIAGSPPSTPNLATANSGVVFGATLVPGVVGNALSFNGISDYVDSPSSIVTNFGPAALPSTCTPGSGGSFSSCPGDFSIDTWIKVDPAVFFRQTVILDKRSGSPPAIFGYSLFLDPGASGLRLGLQLADGGGPGGFDNFLSRVVRPPFTALPLTDGNWHHIAVTVQRGAAPEIRWYHNGLPFGPVLPTSRVGSLVNPSPLRIGARVASPPLTGFFEGALDELEIFNRVLTPTEVLNIYNAGPFGKCR